VGSRTHAEPDRSGVEPAERPEPATIPGPLPPAAMTYALAAGSARVAALARQVAAPPAGALTDAEAREAVEWTNARYDALSIGIIQHLAAVPANGTFDEATAQAVGTFQRDRRLLVDGKVGHQTLTAAFPERVGESAHDQLIHIVADLCEIDITTDISAVRFDETLARRGATEFEPSGMRVIRLGATAFQSSRILRDTLNAQRRGAGPAAPAAGPTPAIVDPADAAFAVLLNQIEMPHQNSVRSIGALVGAGRTNTWTVELVQHLAAFQQANALPGTGIVDQATLEVLVRQLIAAGDNNGAIRAIVDFFDFDDSSNLISIYFDPNETANAETLPFDPANPNQPVSIQIGPLAMAKSFAGLVHTIEHEYVHVREMRAGEGDLATQEFLGEATEMLSPITPQEDLADFMSDARRGLENWNLMPADRQVRHRDRFIAARQRVRDRVAAGTPAEQATHQPTVDGYNAVVVPPAGP
jgi:peptidoglycan hydrolase-like protein with peptidoglycan-binding domain